MFINKFLHILHRTRYNIDEVIGLHKILVVDDEENIRSIIRKYAEFEGYAIEEATDGLDAEKKCAHTTYDLIIMDVMMPIVDGYSAVKEIHKHNETPVIMLSARGEEYDRIHGFEIGIDDYVVKPFSPKELMMRVRAILNRYQAGKKESTKDIYTYKELYIDFTARKVFVGKKELDMSPKEYALLFYFARNEGIALTREQLIHDVWGYDFYGDDRTLDTHIKLLRKRLGIYSSMVVTLRGVGYRFEKNQ